MNVVSACPDTLLVGARSRSLSAEDQARLDAHLARCPACRATLEVGRAFDAGLGAQPGDDEIARRIAARLTASKKRRRFPLWLAAAAVLVTGSVAAATVPRVWNVVGFQFSPPVPTITVPVLRQAAEQSHKASKGRAEPREPWVPPITTAPLASAVVDVPPAAEAPERRTAAEIFAEGNLRRRNGETDAARKAYQELQRLYPGSTEALVSHVSLGRLERASNPSKALKHFQSYLAQSGHSTLAEEALFGKASALEALGRKADADGTWRELLRRFPNSVYGERAKKSLGSE